MVTHIIFDLGNVLIHIHPEMAIAGFQNTCGYTTEQIKKFYLSDLHLAFMEGACSGSELYLKMVKNYPCTLNESEFREIWNQVIGKPKEGIKELINDLKDSYTLAICSNTDPWHWQKVYENFPFIREFKYYFLSFEMKLNKPNPVIFQKILDHMGIQGDQCIFIDDIAENIEAARLHGINGITASHPLQMREELTQRKIFDFMRRQS
ncbi:MAG: HAD family phosphatase [bacterium]|nr:MAG: HAD family phosphatase [bacterium]